MTNNVISLFVTMGTKKKNDTIARKRVEAKLTVDKPKGVRKSTTRIKKPKAVTPKNTNVVLESTVETTPSTEKKTTGKKNTEKTFPEMDPLVLDGTSSLFIDEHSKNTLNEKPAHAFIMTGKKAPDGSRWADPLNGQRKYGMCFRNGILRIGGKKFVNTLKNASETFLFEILYKSFMMCNVKNRVVVTERMVRGALKTMRIKPIVSF